MSKFDELYNLVLEQPAQITVTKPANPTPEELKLLKQLHKSTYNPKSTKDQNNLAHLRKAGALIGGYKDFKKIVPTAYALQYGNTPQGNAYKKRAEQLGVNFSEQQPQPAPEQPVQPERSTDLPSAPEAANYWRQQADAIKATDPQKAKHYETTAANIERQAQQFQSAGIGLPSTQKPVTAPASKEAIAAAAKALNMDPAKLEQLLKTS